MDIIIAKHYPEDFLIDFKHRHHRDAAVALGSFLHGSLDIHIQPWQFSTHDDQVDLKHHARFCLEGVPLHAWIEDIAHKIVASSCDLHYIEGSLLRREDARTLNLWAWTKKPSLIPKVVRPHVTTSARLHRR
ncbi:uncharacterized protein LOC133891508 [Phragmites australis]|uniref:uncharacterized protein LOC133891508 n=1 Tax=Phragmites australis TaxID=29695 RepID=UPI002D778075|nr:uncharacterized protein LOC133891508 [Phragmites australis]